MTSASDRSSPSLTLPPSAQSDDDCRSPDPRSLILYLDYVLQDLLNVDVDGAMLLRQVIERLAARTAMPN